jgi:glycosyltransferase involved in cell wall biosynthesis
VSKHNDRNDSQQQVGTVLIVTPGGLERGGGIGRQMGYFLQTCHAGLKGLDYRIVDSRGPWFIGASPLSSFGAVFYLAHAALTLLLARCSLQPCLLHVNITGRGSTIRKVFLLAVARVLRLRYILHLHDYDYANYYRGRSPYLKRRIATAFLHASAVIVLGQRDREVISQLFKLPTERVIILHNAVPDPLPDVARVDHPSEPCHLLFLGYLSTRKGVPELLRALASLPMTMLPWHATLAGGGPIDEFRKLAEELGVLNKVSFLRWVDEAGVRTLCTHAHVLVLPSHAEGLAMSILEGMSYGLAVVATPVGAHSEVIKSEESGLFVSPGDVPALAGALARVINDESLRRRLGRGGRERFLAEFDVRRYASRLTNLHTRVLRNQDTELEPIIEREEFREQSLDPRHDHRLVLPSTGVTPYALQRIRGIQRSKLFSGAERRHRLQSALGWIARSA